LFAFDLGYSRPIGTLRRVTASACLLAVVTIGTVPIPTDAADPVLVGAGDISSCATSGDSATAKLLLSTPGTVFTTGDNVYDRGTAAQYANCYDPTWGQVKTRTRPTPGNHDYATASAAGYFGYFGRRAGSVGKGYYAYNLGTWRIYALNSNCGFVGCGSTSAQARWLKADLAANPRRCVLAYWHHPLFSSGAHGNTAVVKSLWNILYAYHADVVLNGHDHDYERFARQSPNGVRTAKGLREFVVGTGGRSHYAWGSIKRNSLARNNTTYGVLKLTLHPGSYSWRFQPVAGKTWTDSGTTSCG
jgi:hypothetical protein